MAVEKYLAKTVPLVPPFKHAPTEQLYHSIYNSTGCPLSTRTAPMAHQLEGLAFALYARQALLYFAPQLGKTAMCLYWAEHLKRSGLWRTGKGLIICHAPLGLPVWERETAMHSTLKLRRVHLDPQELEQALRSDCDLIVVPWSGLQEMFSSKARTRKGAVKRQPDMAALARLAPQFSLCVIDEVHMAMHHESLRFRIASRLLQSCKFRLGLTGTPFGRDPYALWAQAFLVDFGRALGPNFYFFQKAFGASKYNPFKKSKEYHFRPDLMPTLKHKLTPLALVYERHEARQLAVQSNIVRLRMYGDQLEAYRSAIGKLVKLKTGDVVEIGATFHRLRQISSGYLPYMGLDDELRVQHFESNPKLAWLREFMATVRNELPMLIFHEYIQTGRLISEALAEMGIPHGWLYGGTADATQMVKDFQEGKLTCLVANAVKGGISISLPQADYVLFYESPVSGIMRKQAESRPMARDASRHLDIEDLICSSTELQILHFLRQGRSLMAALNRRDVRRGLEESVDISMA